MWFLMQNTEDNHIDKRHLMEAIHTMTDVAAAINEFKRRKDLGKWARLDNAEFFEFVFLLSLKHLACID